MLALSIYIHDEHNCISEAPDTFNNIVSLLHGTAFIVPSSKGLYTQLQHIKHIYFSVH